MTKQPKHRFDQAREVASLIEKMRPLLAGQPAQVQGAVLADLLAIFLAGHIVRDDPDATDALRERILTLHLDVVRQLVVPNAQEIHGRSSQ